MNKKKFISKMLSLPRPSIEYRIGERLAKFFPEQALIEGEEGGFDVEAYARAGNANAADSAAARYRAAFPNGRRAQPA